MASPEYLAPYVTARPDISARADDVRCIFADAAAVTLRRPVKWVDTPQSDPAFVKIVHTASDIHLLYDCTGSFRAPCEKLRSTDFANRWSIAESMRTCLDDDRVEVFLWDGAGEQYHAVEMNAAGRALIGTHRFGMRFDFSGAGSFSEASWGRGGRLLNGDEPELEADDLLVGHSELMLVSVSKASIGLSGGGGDEPTADVTLRAGVYRAQWKAAFEDFAWSSWVDPRDEEVNFHRKETFGRLVLQAPAAKPGKKAPATQPGAPTVRCEWGDPGMKLRVKL
jgi:hypothetical protein